MIKRGRLVKEKGLNNNYYEVLNVYDNILQLDTGRGTLTCDLDNYEEVTNGRVDWSKVPTGTTIYYFSDMDYCWVKYEFLEYHKSNIKPSMDFITIKEEKYGALVFTCKDAYIMDDWLENEIRMYQEDVDPKTSDKGTEELEKCLKYVENMTTEEYIKLYTKVLEADTSNVFRDPTDKDIKEDDLLNKTIKKHLKNIKSKPNERAMLKDAYNFIEIFLESNKADNQYFNKLDMLYSLAKIGLKSIDKI